MLIYSFMRLGCNPRKYCEPRTSASWRRASLAVLRKLGMSGERLELSRFQPRAAHSGWSCTTHAGLPLHVVTCACSPLPTRYMYSTPLFQYLRPVLPAFLNYALPTPCKPHPFPENERFTVPAVSAPLTAISPHSGSKCLRMIWADSAQ